MKTKLPRFVIEFCWSGRPIELGTVEARDPQCALILAMHRSRPDIADEISIQNVEGKELLRKRVQPVRAVGEMLP